MDHIPYPASPTYDAIQVPWLVRDDFDTIYDDKVERLQNISQLIHARGLARKHLSKYSMSVLNPFFQETCFVLLREVLAMRGLPLKYKNLIEYFVQHGPDGKRYVCTAKLPELIDQWREVSPIMNPLDEKTMCLKAVMEASLSTEHCRITSNSEVVEDPSLNIYTEDEAIYIFCKVFHETVFVMITGGDDHTPKVDGDGFDLAQQFRTERNDMIREYGEIHQDTMIPLLRSRQKSNNWCPSHIDRMSRTSTSMSYWFSAASSRNFKNHTQCSVYACVHAQVAEADYKSVHTPQCLSHVQGVCPSIGPCRDELLEIIMGGGIPTISVLGIDGENDDELKVLVQDARNENYTAISHVWSDGLGNPHSNSLPACQMRRIATYCKSMTFEFPNQYTWMVPKPLCQKVTTRVSRKRSEALDRKAIFWMDTLCIPVGPDFIREQRVSNDDRPVVTTISMSKVRSFAIRKMKQIYQRAAYTLVLDPCLLEGQFDIYEKAARASTSHWCNRLWTLQEAYLSERAVHYQFADVAMPITNLLTVSEDFGITMAPAGIVLGGVILVPSNGFDEGLQRGFSWLSKIIRDKSHKFHTEHQANALFKKRQEFAKLIGPLASRQTSHMEDESICIGTTLGYDVKGLLRIKNHGERMAHLFSLLGRDGLDPRFLFTSGPRIEQDGFRWAPLSLLDRQKDEDAEENTGNADFSSFMIPKVTPEGFLIRLPFWTILPSRRSPRRPEDDTVWYLKVKTDACSEISNRKRIADFFDSIMPDYGIPIVQRNSPQAKESLSRSKKRVSVSKIESETENTLLEMRSKSAQAGDKLTTRLTSDQLAEVAEYWADTKEVTKTEDVYDEVTHYALRVVQHSMSTDLREKFPQELRGNEQRLIVILLNPLELPHGHPDLLIGVLAVLENDFTEFNGQGEEDLTAGKEVTRASYVCRVRADKFNPTDRERDTAQGRQDIRSAKVQLPRDFLLN
ncbi:hypothetical protein FH972_021008 [Carpinus fangiana]|uniref:Heterokaryon incompatibility domain-containing protein n=1 Tax=Carpinus fangiana TaxID=176857 RepID=A0A5N6KN36_9ROSI|nr:hypothetical protein FH972_021008 [Carpinus fangiana]